MHIRLDRKKLLLLSYFLCCILPAFFRWFAVDTADWSGMMIAEPLFVATILYALALLVNDFKYILVVGILAHVILVASCLNCFFSFPLLAGVADTRDLSLSLSAARPLYWVSLALELGHLALFTTTEIAYQRLKKHK